MIDYVCQIASQLLKFGAHICALSAALSCGFSQANSLSDPVEVSEVDGYVRLLPNLQIYRDKTRSTDIDTIQGVWQRGLFEPLNQRGPGLGLLDYDIWGRFALSNASDRDVHVVLEYPDHGLAYIELFAPDGGGGYTSLGRQSYFEPVAKRAIEHNRYAYPLVIPAHSTAPYFLFLGVDKGGPIFADMRVWREKQFELFKVRETFAFGALFGYLLLVLLFTLVNYYNNRITGLLYYAGFIASNIVSWGAIYGFLPLLLIRDGFHWRYMTMAGALTVSFAALFTREVLNTARHLPRLDKAIVALAAFGIVPVVSAILGLSAVSVTTVELQLLGMIILLVAGIRRSLQGETLALAFVLSWAFYCFGMIVYPVRELGFIDHTPFNYWITPVASIFEVSLLFATIIILSRRAEVAKVDARTQYVQALERQKDLLEQTVDARTSELRSAKVRAEEEARTDMLTQLPNRRLFMERLGEETARRHRQQQPFCLLLLDIDFFKAINDRYGHDAGDRVLQSFAAQVRGLIREYDVLARIGGEEFAVLMPNTTLPAATRLANRICDAVAATPFEVEGHQVTINITGGVAEAREEDTATGLLSRADKHLYEGKSRGRNQISAGVTDSQSCQ